jgi:hypothetical protein
MSCIRNAVYTECSCTVLGPKLSMQSQCRFHFDMLRQLPENIRLGCMGLAVTKKIAYYTTVYTYYRKNCGTGTALNFLCNL